MKFNYKISREKKIINHQKEKLRRREEKFFDKKENEFIQSKLSVIKQKIEEYFPAKVMETFEKAFEKGFYYVFEKGSIIIEKSYNLEKLKKENDILINNKIMTKEVNTNKDFFKFMSFESDYETTNRIIKSLWELNDESAKYFSELKLLLSINSSFENIKIKKGITTVAKNLRDMSDTLLHYLNKKDDITIE